MQPTVTDIRIAAIYRFGLMQRLPRREIAAILSDRAGLSPSKALQLAELWFTSEPYRIAGKNTVS